jgi:hypothetical protein
VNALIALAILTAASPKKIAVLDLEAAGVPEPLVATLSLLLPNAIREANAGVEVISGAEIRSLIGFERQKVLLGCKENSNCIAEVGGALGAGELVSGSLGKVGKTYMLQLRRLDVAQGRTIASTLDTVDTGEDALLQAVRSGVKKLFAGNPPILAPSTSQAATATATTSLGTMTERRRWPGYLLAIGGGVLLVSGLVSTGIAADRYNTLKSQQGAPNYPSVWNAQAPLIRAADVWADWTIVGGTLIGATGVVWILRSPSQAATVSLSVAPNQVSLAGRF